MPVLDLAALLKPIPGPDPGGPLPTMIRDKDPMRDPTALDKLKLDAIEKGHLLAVNDPTRVKLWRDVMKLAQDLFSTRCKNLDWAVSAVDAAVRAGGFAAAREGFQLLTALTTDSWEWLYPRPNFADVAKAEPEERESLKKEAEAEATEQRAGRFQSLDDAGSRLPFPNAFREWIIVELDGAIISVNACRGSDGRAPKVSSEQVQSVARKLGPEKVRESLAEIDGALADLELLRQASEARFTALNAVDLAPTYREIRQALQECRALADEMYAAVEGDGEPAPKAVSATGDESATLTSAKDKITRAGLYKQIAQIADHLTRLEPHSPVPYMLRRVVELQDLPFPQLVREFTKASENVLAFLERSLANSPTGE